LLVGAAPGLAIAGLYKLSLVPTAQLVRNTSLAGLADPARYAEILTAVGREAAQWGFGWKHPLLLLAVFALLLRFGPVPWRAWLVLAGQAGIYVGLYLVTQENLSWLISTSLTRLAAHLWPAAIFLALLSLRPLDPQRDSVVAEPIRIPGGPGKGSRRLRGRAANPAPED
jgi:hypothetical protein